MAKKIAKGESPKEEAREMASYKKGMKGKRGLSKGRKMGKY